MMSKVNVIVAGCCGKMGRQIIEVLLQDAEVLIKGVFEHPRNSNLGRSFKEVFGQDLPLFIEKDVARVAAAGDVIIDFTERESTLNTLRIAEQARCKMVIGTTGLQESEMQELKRIAQRTALVQAPNMGIGVNLLLDVVERMSTLLKEEYNIEVWEMHHNQKKDAPSGTALALAEAAAQGRGTSLKGVAVHGRQGITGARKQNEIGIHSLRGGDVVGEHGVIFAGPGEKIEIRHSVSSRSVFANGALLAAKFLQKKDKGFFTMQEVLGIK